MSRSGTTSSASSPGGGSGRRFPGCRRLQRGLSVATGTRRTFLASGGTRPPDIEEETVKQVLVTLLAAALLGSVAAASAPAAKSPNVHCTTGGC
jgi:hypothetical protein